MKNFGILSRLFSRGQTAPVVDLLVSSVIGQPLMVHPQIGEQLIGAYLHGAIVARPATMVVRELAPAVVSETGQVTTAARNVAVLNISGGLANRYEGDLCDPGPLSYQELRSAFDTAMNDPSVEAIVLRIESPGGMASGVHDIADHIFASRGTKPIYASVDDYAYSAAFAIAAAADQIWVTRTGGVGSVGVISYHYDQSAYDARVGVKVTAVYAGAHKNDMSPHEPLTKDVSAWLQDRMDSMRQLFAESVAKYRGMEVSAVLATEAGIFQGQAGIEIGFADRIGTFHDLLASLSMPPSSNAVAPAPEVQTQPSAQITGNGEGDALPPIVDEVSAEVMETNPSDSDLVAAFTAAIAESDLPPDLSIALLKRGHLNQAPSEAIGYSQTIRDLCFAAGIESVAADYIKSNTPIETARAQLIAAKAEDGPEIVTALPHKTKESGQSSHSEIYSRRRAAAAGTGVSKRQ
jgi:signal peptide peptidase SppA